MDEIEVFSKTQRIIVDQNVARIVVDRVVPIKIVNSGTVGPRGYPGPSGEGSFESGIQVEPLLVWVIDHNLNFFPAGIKFHSLDGETELEPETFIYVNTNRVVAGWPTPTAGTWMLS